MISKNKEAITEDLKESWSYKMPKYVVGDVFSGKFAKLKIRKLDKAFKSIAQLIQLHCDKEGVNYAGYYHLYTDSGIGDGTSILIIDARTGVSYLAPKAISIQYSSKSRIFRIFPQNIETKHEDYVWMEETKEFIREADAQ